ncbi:MAG: hypothetical protein R3F59_29265 [Myxococcota bacterium]
MLIAALLACAEDPELPLPLFAEVGQPAPALELPRAGGGSPVRLSDHRGQVVVLELSGFF